MACAPAYRSAQAFGFPVLGRGGQQDTSELQPLWGTNAQPDDIANSGQQDGTEPQVTRVLTETQTLLLPELGYTSNKIHHSTSYVSQKKSIPAAGD